MKILSWLSNMLKPTVSAKYYFNSKRVSEKEWKNLVQDDWDKMEQHFDNISKRFNKL